MIKNLWKHLVCFLFWHDWTCKAVEGIMPTDEELRNFPHSYDDYARQWCKRCGQIFRGSEGVIWHKVKDSNIHPNRR